MDIKEVRERIKRIRHVQDDSEAAHIEEDKLYADFIRYIAKTGPEPYRQMAQEISKTKEMDFDRWHA